jgi:predicted ATPase
MQINFKVLSSKTSIPDQAINTVYLKIDNWNDHSFVTMFEVYIFDEAGRQHRLENVKIGFIGQTEKTRTYSTLSEPFTTLSPEYFSLGTDVDYYSKLANDLSLDFRNAFLVAMRDVVHDAVIRPIAVEQSVFQASHLRGVSINAIEEQFVRVLAGGVPVTDFKFRFTLDTTDTFAGFELDFNVIANSKPSTNIHAIIGRNGVGKTTLLNEMIMSSLGYEDRSGRFEEEHWFEQMPISLDFFSSLVSISFSAFDPFSPPPDQPDPSKGTCYFYVGLKDFSDEGGTLLKPLSGLYQEFIDALRICTSEPAKLRRWVKAVQTLESDSNFAEMQLTKLANLEADAQSAEALRLIKNMSSGHVIVLLTITKLVSRVEEKTLVLFDEPESHLHPPLLSALIRSLSELLHDRNAVAIIATHSPVVLQEIPRLCAWTITRSGRASSVQRPELETFGENVGSLTREVFGLEVTKSGFNALLAQQASEHTSYVDVLETFNNQIGFEGRAILKSLLHEKARRSE